MRGFVSSIALAILSLVLYADSLPRQRTVFGFVGAPFASPVLLQLASQPAIQSVQCTDVRADGSNLNESLFTIYETTWYAVLRTGLVIILCQASTKTVL